MVVTECGHAYRATVIEGPYWAGIKSGQTPVESLHYVEWIADALRTGKLKIDPSKKIKEPVTYQDSCNYIRNAGLANIPREIMSYIAEDFREMKPCREHNFLLWWRRRSKRYRSLSKTTKRWFEGKT